MGRPNEVKNQFAQLLKEALIQRFGELPSNAIITRDFNLRAYGSEPITQESVRHWLKGISMPEERKLRILVSWLDLDLKACFSATAKNSNEHLGNGFGLQASAQNSLGNAQAHRGLRNDQLRILRLIDALPQGDKKIIEQLAKKLSTRAHRHN